MERENVLGFSPWDGSWVPKGLSCMHCLSHVSVEEQSKMCSDSVISFHLVNRLFQVR